MSESNAPNSSSPTEQLPLPPGNTGLPLLGNTLSFLKDMFGFLRRGVIAHGAIFQGRILNKPTVFVSGTGACTRWLDPKYVQRENSTPGPVTTLFGGPSVAVMDGEAHRVRKQLLLAAFTPEARARYVPILQRLLDSHLDRWTAAGEIDWVPLLKKFGFEGICATIFGLQPGPELDALFADYDALLPGFSALPVRFPGTTFSRAVAARDRIIAFFTRVIVERRQTLKPSDTDGLALLLRARVSTGNGEQGLDDRDMTLELHHIVIAGYIVFAELVAMVMAFSDHPKVRERLAAEVRSLPSTPTLEQLETLPYLNQVVMEVKRFCPNVPVSFGLAKETFELEGKLIPKGWQIIMALGENNRAGYSRPDDFDPDRFSPERAEHLRHPHAFVPQGPGGPMTHRCLGFELTSQFMQLFAVALARSCNWEMLTTDLSLRWDIVPPVPKQGMRVKVSRV